MANHTKRRSIGTIRHLPNGKCLAIIERGYRADGSRRTPSKVFETEQEADTWLMSMKLELDERPELHAGITLRKLWELYKIDREGKLARKTLAAYTWLMEGAKDGHVGCWLDWLGDTDASTITPAMVQKRLSTMPRQKAKHAKNALSSVLSWAARAGLLSANPLRGHAFEYRDVAADEADPFDEDPFAAIEDTREVWGIEATLRCFELIRGLALEPAWLACVGAGLRVEEALALRKMDVRRVEVNGRMVTQLAVHAARTDLDRRKTTKTAQSRRIVAMLEPFGERYFELASACESRDELVCKHSAARQNKTWRLYFAAPPKKWHKRMSDDRKAQGRLHDPKLPYLPLSKMRNTHVTIMAESGVSDSINALMHGHTEMVERRHYLVPDTTQATVKASERFRLVG